jgi:cytidyltransferase-like protein
MIRATGYCAVTADILHSGHIKFLNTCKGFCDDLIVGVMTDECVKRYKGKNPVMPLKDRMEIISNLKMVNKVIPQDTFDYPSKLKSMEGIDYIIDSTQHQRKGADFYVKYDDSVSSTKIKEKIVASCNSRKK